MKIVGFRLKKDLSTKSNALYTVFTMTFLCLFTCRYRFSEISNLISTIWESREKENWCQRVTNNTYGKCCFLGIRRGLMELTTMRPYNEPFRWRFPSTNNDIPILNTLRVKNDLTMVSFATLKSSIQCLWDAVYANDHPKSTIPWLVQ